jgi:hypothetical protein
MGRFGQSLSKIYDININGFQPPFEPYLGQNALQLYDDPDKFKMEISHAPFQNSFRYNTGQKEAFMDVVRRLKIRNNKTELDVKMPRRVEGLQFANARDKPYLNLTENPENFAVPLKLQDLNAEQQRKLMDVYPVFELEQRPMGAIHQALDKVQTPYDIQKLNTETPLDFIKNNRGETMTQMSNNNAVDGMGSTLKPNFEADANQPVGGRSARDLAKPSIKNAKTLSRINARQNNNFKSRQLLGLYMGNPSGVNDTVQRSITADLERPVNVPMKKVRKSKPLNP